LLTRPAHPNAPVPFNDKDAFHRCRGFYLLIQKGCPNIKMRVDLIAAIYRGLLSYSSILQTSGQHKKAEPGMHRKQKHTSNALMRIWWDDAAFPLSYLLFPITINWQGRRRKHFLLWFDALNDQYKEHNNPYSIFYQTNGALKIYLTSLFLCIKMDMKIRGVRLYASPYRSINRKKRIPLKCLLA